MGRDVKRVPLDFNWPIGVIWKGFICPHCDSPTCLEHRQNEDARYCEESSKPGFSGKEWPEECDVCPTGWRETPVPTGEGWQLWENVTEGSPVSPVCAKAEELINWITIHGDGCWPCSREAAEALVKHGWSPSFAITESGNVVTGAEALAAADRKAPR